MIIFVNVGFVQFLIDLIQYEVREVMYFRIENCCVEYLK